jgi:nicotinate-nucleotide--dimethylbenzimidazole phosphoribosyltransferase
VVHARDTGDDLLTAPDSLGVLDAAVNRVLALAGPVPGTGTLVLAAADHPVATLGVSAYPQSVTAEVLAATIAGESLGATAARQAGLRVIARRAAPQGIQGDLAHRDAMTVQDTDALIQEGIRLGSDVAGRGLVCLGEVGIGNTTVAAALCCALLGMTPHDAVGLGSGADSAMLDRKRAVILSAVDRASAGSPRSLCEPMTALRCLGGPEIALLAGVTIGAAAAGVPVVLDGLATSLAALIAVRLEPATQAALVAGHRSRERAHGTVLTELGLEPLLALRLRAGEGVGACLAAQLLLTTLQVRRTAGRVR